MLFERLRALADTWDKQAEQDVYRHGDAWCRAMDDCAEQLREVLNG